MDQLRTTWELLKRRSHVPRKPGRTHEVAQLNQAVGGSVSIVGGGGVLTTLWERERRLKAAHEAMDELCATILRLACMWTPEFGEPEEDPDALTSEIYNRAFDAGLWIEASKGIVKEMQGSYPRGTRERLQNPHDIEVRQAVSRAQDFYELDPLGEHVKELAICLLDHAFPTEADKAIGVLLDEILEEDIRDILEAYRPCEQALAVPEPNVQELAVRRTGLPKKTLALALVVCFLAGAGEWMVLLPILIVGFLGCVAWVSIQAQVDNR